MYNNNNFSISSNRLYILKLKNIIYNIFLPWKNFFSFKRGYEKFLLKEEKERNMVHWQKEQTDTLGNGLGEVIKRKKNIGVTETGVIRGQITPRFIFVNFEENFSGSFWFNEWTNQWPIICIGYNFNTLRLLPLYPMQMKLFTNYLFT